MKPSTKRTIRTIYQNVIAIATFVPVAAAMLPDELSSSTLLATYAVWLTAVVKIINAAEDTGLLPAWLKTDD